MFRTARLKKMADYFGVSVG